MSDDYADLLATLRWGATLDLTAEQRKGLEGLCCRIGGCVPSWRLKETAEAKRTAQGRVAELEAVLRNKRQEWVFRRGSTSRQLMVDQTK